MKKIVQNSLIALLLTWGGIVPSHAQSAVEALKLSETELYGTARFVGMGGAFTSLGGDVSTLTQNPAGIGVFRNSDLSATLNISMQSSQVDNLPGNMVNRKTRALFDNLGLVGTMRLGRKSMLENINFGVAYNRKQSFSRTSRINYARLNGSLTNAIAGLCNTYPDDLLVDNGAYENPDVFWLDALAYDNFLITNTSGNRYEGMWNDRMTAGSAFLDMHESGYNSEYSFNFGGNISNRVFFGIGIGITDLKYSLESDYQESLDNTQGMTEIEGMEYPIMASNYSLYNELLVKGTGVNVKFGLIAYITDSWRIGAAVHTPTFYSFTRTAYGDILNKYIYADQHGEVSAESNSYTPVSTADFRLRSPMSALFGTSYMIGSRAIISADYELTVNKRMKMLYADGYEYADNEDFRTYLKNSHTIRVGAEFRLLPQLSLRAGYAHTTTPASDEWLDNRTYIPTAGTLPSYTLNRSKQIYSTGIGYRFGAVYLDAAYQHRRNICNVMAYSAIPDLQIAGAENARLIAKNNNIILTFGVKF